jgi:hypothetical protein
VPFLSPPSIRVEASPIGQIPTVVTSCHHSPLWGVPAAGI